MYPSRVSNRKDSHIAAIGVETAMVRSILGALLALVISALPLAGQVGSPAGPVPVEFLAARRAALLERIDDGIALVRSADPREQQGDYPQDGEYREDNDFFYLTGLEAPGGWLLLSGTDELVRLYLPARDPEMERWTGPTLGPGPEAAEWAGISEVRALSDLACDLAELRRGSAEAVPVYIKPGRSQVCERLAEVTEQSCTELLGVSETDTRDLRPHLAALRLIKDEDELRRLRRAIEITTDAQRAAMRSVRPGLWEYEIEALIEYTFRKSGAERVGFPSIIGSGPNSTILHYDKSRREMEYGDLVVMDIGAEYGYYTADVTRTIPVSGKFTPRQREIYDLVLGAQEAAFAATKPGVTVGQLNQIARNYIRDNSGDLCGQVTCDRYFVHGLSHWLGLDVHDVGDYSTPLAPGMVLTIEPGIYLPEEGFGVRIEDDFLVTEDGAELLSAGAPRQADEIEKLMAEGPVPLP